MNKPLASLIVAASLVLGAGTALAQDVAPGAAEHGDCRGHGERFTPEAMERRITHLTERLSLDAHQVTLVREIFASTRTQAEALRAQPAGPERRAAIRALMQTTHARIDAVLTDAQRAQFTAMAAERRARFEGRRGHRHEGAARDRGI